MDFMQGDQISKERKWLILGRYRNNKDGTKSLIAGRGDTDAIESQIGYVEPTDIASSAHAVGSYFINKSGQFVKTTAAIAVGDTIAIGTNVVATDIAGVLGELNADLKQSLKRGDYKWTIGSVEAGTVYSLNFTELFPNIKKNNLASMTFEMPSGASAFDINCKVYMYFESNNGNIQVRYNCAYTQSSAGLNIWYTYK